MRMTVCKEKDSCGVSNQCILGIAEIICDPGDKDKVMALIKKYCFDNRETYDEN